jgi:hypothetical protein
MQPATPSKIERMLARDEIHEVLANYARGVDRGDGPLLKSCYHPDAIEEHGGAYAGNAFDYVDGAVPRIQRLGPMQHLLGSTHIDFQGDIAYAETYVWTMLRVSSSAGDLDTITGGRLIDRFEKRHGAWKIAHRRTIFDWNRDMASHEAWVNGMFTPGTPGMLQGIKGSADPSYERF